VNLYRALAPLLFNLDPERAHGLAIAALKFAPVRRPRPADPLLAIRLWDLDFPNPVGMAAGFDKNAEVADALLGRGFGFVEIGTVTPRPQAGNPKPRLYRLSEDEAVINRLGFNGNGLAFARSQLAARDRGHGIIGANVGRNRDSSDEIADYVTGIRELGPFADYCVVNVSSPNTPGLRDLQARDRLADLLGAAVAARNAIPGRRIPLLVKVAPDLDETEIRDIAEVALAAPVDGIIATNTTVERPATLHSRHKAEAGGLSGRPVFARATRVLHELRAASGGKLPLIGVGGIFSGADALAKIKAGASLVQLYSGMVYEGPGIARAIARDLATQLKAEGFGSLGDAVGAAHR
jgi:dihydroorotate dehydrogenase